MNEHTQRLGVRKWAGDDLVELQKEGLDALQALVEPYAPCIIQGCEVRRNGEENTYTVSPGFVALRGNLAKESEVDEERQGVKIVRFEGMGKATLPLYLGLGCETENRPYLDGVNKPVKYRYVAEKLLEQSPDCLTLTGDNAAPRLVDTLGITQKLDREGGNASNVKVESFKEDTAAGRINIAAGMTMKELFGKIYRWLRDLKPIAFKDKVAETDLETTLGNKLNVQADWNEKNTDNRAFIKNKPASLPASGGMAQTISSILPLAKGGTGKSNGEDAANVLLNSLSAGTDAPKDADYYIAQYSGGGTSVNTYHRRPVSKLLDYIKSKLALVATSGSYNDLTNKPTIPTVNNGTITIKQAGTTKGTFTVNQNGDTTIELTDNNTDTVYTHPQYTVGGSTSNGSPAFGGSFTVYKPTVNNLGHTTSISQTTVKIPSSVASTSAAGLMSAADKTKLDGIATGANAYTHPTTAGNKHIPTGGSSGQYLKYYASGTAVWSKPTASEIGAAESSHSHDAATQSAAGFMSAVDKTKLDGIATGANAYTHPTTAGNKHIPTGGSSGQYLKYSASGTATWNKPTASELGAAAASHSHAAATESSAGFMSASDKTNLNSLFKFRIVGVYTFNENGSLGNYQGFPIGCSQATSPVNPCYKITLYASNGFSASKSYFIICTAGLGHTIECYDTFVQGGKSTYIIYRNTNGTAELSSYAPRIVIVELNT